MNAEIYNTLAGIREEPQLVIDVVDRFDNALNSCTEALARGDNMVIVPDNIIDLFGDKVMELFKKTLAEKAGLPIDFTPMESANASHTIVKMPKNNGLSPQGLPATTYVRMPDSGISECEIDAFVAAYKKAPRPMNSWIIFRDAMHKQLKAEFPQLSVQETSTRCSEIWRSLTPEGKKPWQAAAQSAKEEHLRQYPDYKYTPRKPGEKKKRQSRKFKHSSAAANVPEVLNFQLTPNVAMPSPGLTLEHAPPVNDTTADSGNAFIDEFAQLFEPANVFDMLAQDSVSAGLAYDSESFRHGLLDNEFRMGFDMDATFALINDDAFAFRAGANGDVLLPGFFQDSY